MKVNRLILLLLVVPLAKVSFSQNEGSSLLSGYTFSLTGGHTIPNSEEWNYISDNYFGIDIAESRIQLWHLGVDTSLIRRPYQMGLRANISFYPNSIAGHKLGLAGYIIEPLIDAGNHHLGLEMDAGIAIYNHPYRLSHDASNVFIGSFINCLIQIGLSYSYGIPHVGDIVLAGKFLHSSNGYLVKPNKGLNYMQAELGFRPSQLTNKGKDIRFSPSDIRGGDWFASYAAGIVMPRYETSQKKYFYAHTARMGWLYHFNAARAAGVNIDLTYNYSFDALLEHYKDDYPLPFYVGLAAAYEATYHRITLHVAMAKYLLRSEHGTTPLYERVGLFYNLGDQSRRLRHFIGISLKSHMAHVDFIEWHYGIKIR